MFKHTTLIALSGLIWFAIGVYLLQLGLHFLLESTYAVSYENYPLINFLKTYSGTVESAVLVLVACGLLIGYMKGKYVLGKSAQKGVERIRSFPNPTSLKNIYSLKYYILLALMIGLGMSVKYLGFAKDVRGLVDVAIGSALVNGAMCYFRLLQTSKKSEQASAS